MTSQQTQHYSGASLRYNTQHKTTEDLKQQSLNTKKSVQGQTETEQGVGFLGCCGTSTSEMAAPSITARTGMKRCISPYKCKLDMSEAR